MTIRIGTSELARKGIRYRALDEGTFELSGTARIRAGRTVILNSWVDLCAIGPNVDIIQGFIRCQQAVEDSGNAVRVELRTVNMNDGSADQTLSGAGGAFLDATSTANTRAVRFENTGVASAFNTGSATILFIPKYITANTTPGQNVYASLYAPRAYPLVNNSANVQALGFTASQVPPLAGNVMLRLHFTAAPGVQTTSAAADRLFHFNLLLRPAALLTTNYGPYQFADTRDNTTLLSNTPV